VDASHWAPLDVARLEEARLARVIAQVALEHEPFAGGALGWGGHGSWQNGAYGAGMTGPVSDDELERFCAFYRVRGVEPRIELAPCADRTLIEGLAERGFVIQQFENVLFLPLAPDEPAPPAPSPPHDDAGRPLQFRQVDPRDDADVRLFAHVVAAGFREQSPLTDNELETTRRTLANPETESYFAMFGDEAVGGGSLDVFPEVASLYGASTLSAFRRRGVQRALLAIRLARARERGCRIATIGSQPGIATERNAMRLGFRVAYTKAILRKPEPGLARSP
jgi:GNAT superfamily N-acetyltransferase